MPVSADWRILVDELMLAGFSGLSDEYMTFAMVGFVDSFSDAAKCIWCLRLSYTYFYAVYEVRFIYHAQTLRGAAMAVAKSALKKCPKFIIY